jgi:YggT family protein
VSAYSFLVETLFGLYILVIMLRFLLQWAKADFYNDISQFIVRLTNPLLRPLRRIIPGILGLDFAAIVLMLILQVIELLLLGYSFNGNLLIIAIVQLIRLAIHIFLIVIIIQVILSWLSLLGKFPMTRSHSIIRLLYQLSEPILGPLRRVLPAVSGFDFSPLVATLLLIFLNKLLSDLLLMAGIAGA